MQNPGRSLHNIPGQNAMSFIDKSIANDWRIKRLDCASMAITDIGPTIPGHEFLTWTNDGQLLSSDGTKIFFYQPGSNTGWQPVGITNTNHLLKGITRMAISADNTRLAIVVSE